MLESDQPSSVARDPYAAAEIGTLSRGKRLTRGLLVVALIAAAGALMFATPDGTGGTSVEAAGAEEPAAPSATAEMLQNARSGAVDMSLGPSESLESMASAADALRSGTPADSSSGFDAVVTEIVGQATAPATTTTTVFVEPELPPASEWVDGGNGVLVPDILLRIRFCESTNNYLAANSYSSARGAYQFLTGSWDWYGHAAITGVTQAHLATPAQQDEAAVRTLQAEGTGPWAESRPCWNDPNIASSYATAAPPATIPPAPEQEPETEPEPDTETDPETDPDSGQPEPTVPEGQETTTTVGDTPTTTVPETETTVETPDTTEAETTSTTASPAEEQGDDDGDAGAAAAESPDPGPPTTAQP